MKTTFLGKTAILGFGFALVLMAPIESAFAQQSFRHTCPYVRQRGSSLIASCFNVNGRLVQSGIDLRTCPIDAVANHFGVLTCERPSRGFGGGGYGGGRDHNARDFENHRGRGQPRREDWNRMDDRRGRDPRDFGPGRWDR